MMEIYVFILCCIADLHNTGFKYFMYLFVCIHHVFHIMLNTQYIMTHIHMFPNSKVNTSQRHKIGFHHATASSATSLRGKEQMKCRF